MRFVKGEIYHIYNRSFEQTILFPKADNYTFFLKKIKSLSKYCHVLAYCLMPNHFHLLVFIDNSNAVALNQYGSIQIQTLSKKIGIILSSYTQAVNKQENRKGSLFQPKTKSKPIESQQHGFNSFHYIHQNPIKAGLAQSLEDWSFSSFNEYFKGQQGLCSKTLAYELLDIPVEVNHFYNQSCQVINLEGV